MTDLQTTTVNDGGMGAMLARQMMKYGQTMEDGALGIIKCMVDVDAKSENFMDQEQECLRSKDL